MPRALLQRLMPWSKTKGVVDEQAFQLPGAIEPGARILLIDSGDPCDLLVCMPFLLAIRDQVEGAVLGMVGSEQACSAAQASGLFEELIVLDEDSQHAKQGLARELEEMLGSEDWTVAILPSRQADPGGEAIAAASRARLRIGPGHPNAWPAINCELRAGDAGPWRHGRMSTLTRLLGLNTDDERPSFPLAEKRARQVAQLVHFNKPRADQILVAVDPGLGKEGGRLSAANLAYVVNHLANHVRCKVQLLSCDMSDPQLADLDSQLRGERLELPREDFSDVLHLLGQSSLLLGGNTDLFHFAWAMGIPAVGLFTPQDLPAWEPPDGAPAAVLSTLPGEPLPLAELMAEVDRLLAG